ncbi:MAG: polysaccharide biosynthesis/export family protein [Paracoccaceae bacterium]|nr:polysaccharide biosynthesis/export family protein [Paracoccaceae bacterium]
MKHSLAGVLIGLALILFPALGKAQSEYRLNPGDVVRFTVVGLPDLTTEAFIDGDGKIQLPFVGAVQADGITLEELNVSVGLLLDGQIIRFVNREGGEAIITVGPGDVQVTIAAYRPIVVYGAVVTPGEIAFRPGMTARVAVAIAGGFRVVQAEGGTALRWADLSGQIIGLRLRRDFLRDQGDQLGALLETMRTEATNTGSGLSEEQKRLLDMKLAAADSQETNITQSIIQLDERLRILRKREKAENEAADIDAEDKARIDKLLQRGIVSAGRASDVRRAQLLSSTRLLQTQDAMANAEFNRRELERALDQLEFDREIQLTEALQENELQLAENEARVAALKQQLVLLTGTDDTGIASQVEFIVMIHRKEDGKAQASVAALDDLLHPGDVIEVVTKPVEE